MAFDWSGLEDDKTEDRTPPANSQAFDWSGLEEDTPSSAGGFDWSGIDDEPAPRQYSPDQLAAESERQRTGKRKLFDADQSKDDVIGESKAFAKDLALGAAGAAKSVVPFMDRRSNPAFGESGATATAGNVAGGFVRGAATQLLGTALTRNKLGGSIALAADRALQIGREEGWDTFQKHPIATATDVALSAVPGAAPSFQTGVRGILKPLAIDAATGAGQGGASAIHQGADLSTEEGRAIAAREALIGGATAAGVTTARTALPLFRKNAAASPVGREYTDAYAVPYEVADMATQAQSKADGAAIQPVQGTAIESKRVLPKAAKPNQASRRQQLLDEMEGERPSFDAMVRTAKEKGLVGRDSIQKEWSFLTNEEAKRVRDSVAGKTYAPIASSLEDEPDFSPQQLAPERGANIEMNRRVLGVTTPLFPRKGDPNVEPTGKGQGQAPRPEVEASRPIGPERKGDPSSPEPVPAPAQGAGGAVPATPIGGDTPDIEKYAGSANVKRFAPDSPEEQEYIHKLYQDNQRMIDEQRGTTGEPGESKFSRKSLHERAAEHEWTDEKVARLKPNQALNDEQATSLDNFARGFLRVARESKSTDDIGRAVSYLKAASGVASAQGRALGARNEARKAWVNSMQPADRAAFNLSRFYKDREIPKDVLSDLLKVDPTDETALNKVLKKAAEREAGKWGQFKNFRYANMLSSPLTWGLNAQNGIAMAIADPVERQIRSGIDAALPGQRATVSGENRAALAGQKAGAADGMRRFLYVMQNGFTPKSAKELDPAKVYTELPGGGKNPMNWPSRILEATDQFFLASAEGAELNSLAFRRAYREGNEQGKSGADLDSFIANRAAEIMDNDQEMRKMAGEYAQRRTSREKMPQMLESFSETANSSLGDIKMGDKRLGDAKLFKPLNYAPNPIGLVAPFIRIPFNSLKKGLLDYGPQGLLTSAAVGATKGRAEGTRTAAQAVVGTAILGATAPLIISGRITGAVPSDPGEREAFYEARKKPYSVKIGDRWFDYRVLGSLALPFIEATAAHDSWKANGEVLDGTAAAKTLGRIGQYSIDSSYLAGINGLLSAVANPESTKAEASLSNILSQFVPAAALQRFINNREGSQLPDANTVGERVVAGTLFKDILPARKNQLGMDIKRGGPFPSEKNADPVYVELDRLGMGVPQASRIFKAKDGKYQKFTPEQYRQILGAGSPVYEKLRLLVSSSQYAAMSEEAKRAKIEAQFDVLLGKRQAQRQSFAQTR